MDSSIMCEETPDSFIVSSGDGLLVASDSEVSALGGSCKILARRSITWKYKPWQWILKDTTIAAITFYEMTVVAVETIGNPGQAPALSYLWASKVTPHGGWRSTDESPRNPRASIEASVLIRNKAGALVDSLQYSKIINCKEASFYISLLQPANSVASFDDLSPPAVFGKKSWWLKC